MKGKHTFIKQLFLLIAGLGLLYAIGQFFYVRIDMTKDKRYTLASVTKDIVNQADSPVIVDVLLGGKFPPEFRKLQSETRQLLEEFATENSHIKFSFINPMEEESETLYKTIEELGIEAAQVSVTESGRQSVEVVFPWAIAHYQGSKVAIPLLKNQLGATTEDRVNSSLQNLQYAFADGFKKLLTERSKKIAVLKGNGELEDKYIFDFISTIRDYYYTAPFTLDSVATNPSGTLKALREFDLIIVAKPTKPFTEEQKYVLDQYIMDGGNSLWLIDMTQMHIDPDSGGTFAFGLDLNLNDFLFRYGVRINPNLVKDIYAAPIVLASGEERNTQYDRFPWFFSPLSSSHNNHPIVTNMEAVKFDYASAIDTLESPIDKTILLTTSPFSRRVGLPFEIDLNSEIAHNLEVINSGTHMELYNSGEVPLAVLLEGKFTSVYKNRVKPFQLSENMVNMDEGHTTKMVVVSDGDLIKNQMAGNRPLELGFDRMTNSFYGNKEFLLNTVNYLLDDTGLINLRTKQIQIAFLDPIKVIDERIKFQFINILIPILLFGIFGFIFNYLRKRKNVK